MSQLNSEKSADLVTVGGKKMTKTLNHCIILSFLYDFLCVHGFTCVVRYVQEDASS